MKIEINTEEKTVSFDGNGETGTLPLYSKESFELISDLWVKVGWNEKYSYSFSWFGMPIIQLPEDMIRMQEVIYRLKPDVIIETGVAHGGSLVYYASLFEAMGRGTVIGVDIEIRPYNRAAIEAHDLFHRIELIEGSSTDRAIVSEVECLIPEGAKVLVILDSNHSKEHVSQELELYHQFVTPGSYIVATDGVMKDVSDVPRGDPEWIDDNPVAAASEFVAQNDEFILEQPDWPFNESELSDNITHWPNSYIRRKS